MVKEFMNAWFARRKKQAPDRPASLRGTGNRGQGNRHALSSGPLFAVKALLFFLLLGVPAAAGTCSGGPFDGDVCDTASDCGGTACFSTIRYYGNGSDSGSTSGITSEPPITINQNGFLKTGYTFTKWNTAADGSGKNAFIFRQIHYGNRVTRRI